MSSRPALASRLRGPLAIDPHALTLQLCEPFVPPATILAGELAVVGVRGPLDHHASTSSDSYDAVLERVRAAIEAGARTIVLDVDSPGGVVSGMLDGARTLRALVDERAVRLIAFVSGDGASAAYVLASAAAEIVASRTAIVGSIGVLETLVDETIADAARGERWHTITSGARKSDGHPHVPVTDEVVRARQGLIDELARAMAEHVAERRRLSVEEVLALNASVMLGERATDAGLVDRVSTLPELLAELQAPRVAPSTGASSNAPRIAAMSAPATARAVLPTKAAPPRSRAAAPKITPPKVSAKPKKEETTMARIQTLSAEVERLGRSMKIERLERATLPPKRRSSGVDDATAAEIDARLSKDKIHRGITRHGSKTILGSLPRERMDRATIGQPKRAAAPPARRSGVDDATAAEIDARLSKDKIHRGITRQGLKTILGSLPREEASR